MPQFKFGQNDIFHNVIKAYPKYTISMYLNQIYINRRIEQGLQVLTGTVSLHEMNVDRGTGSTDSLKAAGHRRAEISASITKGENSLPVVFKDVVKTVADYNAYNQGADILLKYPRTASIDRFLLIGSSGSNTRRTTTGGNGFGGINFPFDGFEGHRRPAGSTIDPGECFFATASYVKNLIAMRSAYNGYRTLSPYFDFDKYILVSGGMPPVRGRKDEKGEPKLDLVYDPPGYKLKDGAAAIDYDASKPNFTSSIPWNKYTNVIAIPKLLYGDGIKRGSVDLKFYFTGTLASRAQDEKQNGVLIETYVANPGRSTGSVVGTVMYNEGIIILTSSVPFRGTSQVDGYLCPTGARGDGHGEAGDDGAVGGGYGHAASASYITASSWVHFGAYKSYITASDSHHTSSSYGPCSSSYEMIFRGTTHTPVLTMLPQAAKNELNWSNNPSYISSSNRVTDSWGKTIVKHTGAYGYKEDEELEIRNTISSSHHEHSASVFKPQTFISKIGIYNEDKELIAVAKFANPIRKTSEQDYTFKLKLDL